MSISLSLSTNINHNYSYFTFSKADEDEEIFYESGECSELDEKFDLIVGKLEEIMMGRKRKSEADQIKK